MRQPVLFVLVGTLAALVHYGVALLLMLRVAASPQAANFGGWSAAVLASYAGQTRLTFAQPQLQWRTFRRFLTTAAVAGSVNAAVYQLLLETTRADARILLAVAILAAAACTFALSRSWVFSAATRASGHRA